MFWTWADVVCSIRRKHRLNNFGWQIACFHSGSDVNLKTARFLALTVLAGAHVFSRKHFQPLDEETPHEDFSRCDWISALHTSPNQRPTPGRCLQYRKNKLCLLSSKESDGGYVSRLNDL